MAITSADILTVLKNAGLKQAVIDKLDHAKPLLSQGFDSLDLAVIETATVENYGVTRKQMTSAKIKSLNDLVAYVNKKK
jgi:acyl carrier protein